MWLLGGLKAVCEHCATTHRMSSLFTPTLILILIKEDALIVFLITSLISLSLLDMYSCLDGDLFASHCFAYACV